MTSAPKIARRIVLRLDPRLARDGASLASATRMARAFNAELAARLVSDTRFAASLTSPAGSARPQGGEAFSVDVLVRRAETTYRRTVSAAAEHEQAAWSFSVVACAGVLSECGAIEPDDLVALDVQRLAGADLRREVESALSHARGALLFPSAAQPRSGPVVVIANDRRQGLIEQAEQIASALDAPLIPIERTVETESVGELAAAIRKRSAMLAVIDALDALAQEFVARPRFLRELDAPLLLLKVG